MKTEDFDDAIRKKLESLDYDFKAKDIDRIQLYVQNNISSTPFWRRYLPFFFLSANALVLIASLILNFRQIKEQEILSKKIEILEKDIAKEKANELSFKTTDTINAVGTVTINENVQENYPIVAFTQRVGDHRMPNYTMQRNHEDISSGVKHSEKSKFNKLFFNNKSDLDKQKINVVGKFPDGFNNNTNDRNDLNENIDENNTITKKRQIVIDNKSQEIQTADAINYNESKILKSLENSIVYPSNANNLKGSIVVDSLIKNKIVEQKDSILYSNIVKKKTHVKNNLSLKNLGFQAGFGIEKANNQIGGTFIGELFISKRFSINAGVKLLTISADHYKDENDFYNKRQEKFNAIYAPNLSDNSLASVSEISMSYNIIQLPVAFTYYQPLKKNYSLLFSAGTDFDLHNKFHIQYELGYKDAIHEHDNFKYSNVFFNNAVLSAGVQKQWNHFNIQLSPFVSSQIKQVDYKKDNLYGGVRIRVFYQFK